MYLVTLNRFTAKVIPQPKSIAGFVVRVEKAAEVKPNYNSLAETEFELRVNKHKVSRLNPSLCAVKLHLYSMTTVSCVLACDSLNTVALFSLPW